MANNNQKPTNNQERATAIFELAVSINKNTRLANELAARKEESDKANWQAEEFFRELPEAIGSNSTVNIAGHSIARNVPGIEQLLDVLDKLGVEYYKSLEASQALPKLNSFYAQLVANVLGIDDTRFFNTLTPAGDITELSKISNKDSKTNPAESDEGKTTTSLDKPFVISKLDLSILNNSLGTQFRPMVWIAIPQN